jgi:hypothetical protein
LRDFWQKVDAWGYDSLWAFDHFYSIFVPDPAGPCMKSWTLLGALSQVTSGLGTGANGEGCGEWRLVTLVDQFGTSRNEPSDRLLGNGANQRSTFICCKPLVDGAIGYGRDSSFAKKPIQLVSS